MFEHIPLVCTSKLPITQESRRKLKDCECSCCKKSDKTSMQFQKPLIGGAFTSWYCERCLVMYVPR